jgi:protein-disulfide isomerase
VNRVLAWSPFLVLAFGAGWWCGRQNTAPEGEPWHEHRIALEQKLNHFAREIEDLSQTVRAAFQARGAEAEDAAPAPARVTDLELGESPLRGDPKAPVAIAVFSDFQCPYCSTVPPVLSRLLSEHPGKVNVVFKHNPLPNHLQAFSAHKAAQAAGEQGKFWEMHDVLFANQDRLDPESLTEYARLLSLNVEQFQEAMESAEVLDAIAADRREARRVGVQAVPSFFVNGRLLAGSKPYEVLEDLVEDELRRLEEAGGGRPRR